MKSRSAPWARSTGLALSVFRTGATASAGRGRNGRRRSPRQHSRAERPNAGPLGWALLPLLLADAARGAEGESGRWIAAEAIDGLVEFIPQRDGGVTLVLADGRIVELAPSVVRLEGDAVFVSSLLLDGLGLAHAVPPSDSGPVPDAPAPASLPAGTLVTVHQRAVPDLAELGGAGPGDMVGSALQAAGGALYLAAAVAGAGLGGIALVALGDGDEDGLPGFPGLPQADPVSGLVIDGYIRGAVVTRGNASVTTDAQGFFQNLGGIPGAPLVVTGGVDLATGQAFTGTLAAPAGATVVTPLTTLVQALVASGVPLEAALASVVDGLGLPSALATTDGPTSLLTFDPIAAATASGDLAELGVATAVRGVQVATLLQIAAEGDAARFLELAGGLARAVAAESFDPADADQVAAFLQAAGASPAVLARAAEIAGIGASLERVNSLEDAAALQRFALQDVEGIVPADAPAPAFEAPEAELVARLGAADLLDGIRIPLAFTDGTPPAGVRVLVLLEDGTGARFFVLAALQQDGDETFVLVPPEIARQVADGPIALELSLSVPGQPVDVVVPDLATTIDRVLELNAADDAQTLDAALAVAAEALGIDLAPLNALGDGARTAALDDLAANRPEAGFVATDLGVLLDGLVTLRSEADAVLGALDEESTLTDLDAGLTDLRGAVDTARAGGVTSFDGAPLAQLAGALARLGTALELLSTDGAAAFEGAFQALPALAGEGGFASARALTDALEGALAASLELRPRLASDTGRDAADGISQDGTVLVEGLEPAAAWAWSSDGGATFQAGQGTSFVLAEGSYGAGAVIVRQTLAGVTSESVALGAVRIDTAAPVAPTLDIVAGDDVILDAERGTGLEVTGSAEAGASVRVTLGEASLEAVADGAGAWSVTFAAATLPRFGEAVLTAVATYAAGNAGPAAERAVEFVTDDPAIALDAIAADDMLSAAEAEDGLAIAGRTANVAAGSEVTVTLLSSEAQLLQDTATVAADGSWSLAFPSEDVADLADGELTVIAEVELPGGGTVDAERLLTLDRVAPAVAVDDFSTGVETVDGVETLGLRALAAALAPGEGAPALRIAGTAEPGAVIDVAAAGSTVPVTADAAGAWSVDLALAAVDDGTLELAVMAADAAGNTTDAPLLTFAVDRTLELDRAADGSAVEALLDDLAAVFGAARGVAALSAAGRAELAADLLGNRPVAGYEDGAALGAVFDPLLGWQEALAELRLVADGAVALDGAALAARLEAAVGLTLAGTPVSAADAVDAAAGLDELAALPAGPGAALAALTARLTLGVDDAVTLDGALARLAGELGAAEVRFDGALVDGEIVSDLRDVFAEFSSAARDATLAPLADRDVGTLADPLQTLRGAFLDGLRVEVENTEFPPGGLVFRAIVVDLIDDLQAGTLANADFAVGGPIDQLREGVAAAEAQGQALDFAGIEFTAAGLQLVLDTHAALGDRGKAALLDSVEQSLALDLVDAVADGVGDALLAEVDGAADLVAMVEAVAVIEAVSAVVEVPEFEGLAFATAAQRDAFAESLLTLRADAGGSFGSIDALEAAVDGLLQGSAASARADDQVGPLAATLLGMEEVPAPADGAAADGAARTEAPLGAAWAEDWLAPPPEMIAL